MSAARFVVFILVGAFLCGCVLRVPDIAETGGSFESQ